ncbi:MAG TPA: glycosyltransferase family 39 protein [Pyrinomonadaceae bacterium]|nr:glycosyltransferase family 39 protein [Pyrinomonadaceae bacterium]
MTSTSKNGYGSTPAILFAVFAVVCLVAFFAYRGGDIGKLGPLVGNIGGGSWFGASIVDSIVGGLVAAVILIAWFGVGTFVFRYLKVERMENHSHVLELVRNIAVGAAITSLVWFFLGLAGLYSTTAAIIVTAIGALEGVLSLTRVREAKSESRVPERAGMFDKVLLLLIAIPVVLALISAIAPPIAKDTLLYHFAVPKNFIGQHSNAYIDGNIASYLALGTEMHVVWARLLGGIYSERAAEVAGSVTVWLFFPLLLAAVFGWARELDISRRFALLAVLIVAAVPTAYHVASSGYIDVALALYVTLAIYSLCRWWREPSNVTMLLIAIFVGAALSIKLTTAFVIAAFALVVLLRARNPVAIAPGSDSATLSAGKIAALGFGALLLAGVFASPTYLRTWAATGSPVFPFYMSIWPGKAEGWDVERSNLFQAMNSQYGGADVDKSRYLTAPVMVSVAAQPEEPKNYDGVLGVAFLLGLPLLLFALWKLELPVEAKIAAGVAGIMFAFWLFSSAQLRYLLPIVPALAIAIMASVGAYGRQLRSVAQYAFAAASLAGILTTFAWFCQKAPLRVALGGETKDEYLLRNLDYYSYYQLIGDEVSIKEGVWLINMRRDTYNSKHRVFSDYLFEDWTLRKLVWESSNITELRTKAKDLGIRAILTRHDFLFDYQRSTLVDEKKSRGENEAKLKLAKELLLDGAVKSDAKFSLVKLGS